MGLYPQTKNHRQLKAAERGELILPREDLPTWLNNAKQLA